MASASENKQPPYAPTTDYERETVLHLVATAQHCRTVGTADQRIDYAEAYLKHRYGNDPSADKVPAFFNQMYNTADGNESLDLDVWLVHGFQYVTRTGITDLRKSINKATKGIRKFIK